MLLYTLLLPPQYHPAMEKLTKSQLAKVLFLLILLLFIPFVSSSLRHSYLYFLLNLLIIALGLEAGFLRATSRPHEVRRIPSTARADALPVVAPGAHTTTAGNARQGVPPMIRPTTTKMRKTVAAVKKVDDPPPRKRTSLRRCPSSKPSIFFIGGGAGGGVEEVGGGVGREEIKWEGEREMSKQELFAKAEDFIGNFYMQLKMQREESWKKIHGFYNHRRS